MISRPYGKPSRTIQAEAQYKKQRPKLMAATLPIKEGRPFFSLEHHKVLIAKGAERNEVIIWQAKIT